MNNVVIGDALTQATAIREKLSFSAHRYACAGTVNGLPPDEIPGLPGTDEISSAYAAADAAIAALESVLGRALEAYGRVYRAKRPWCADRHLAPEREPRYGGSRAARVGIARGAADELFRGYESSGPGLAALYGDNMYLYLSGWYRLDVRPPITQDEPVMIVALNAATLSSRESLVRALLDSSGCADCMLWEAHGRARRVLAS